MVPSCFPNCPGAQREARDYVFWTRRWRLCADLARSSKPLQSSENCKRHQDLIRPLHEEFSATSIGQGCNFRSSVGLRSISVCFTSKRRLAPRRKLPWLVIRGKCCRCSCSWRMFLQRKKQLFTLSVLDNPKRVPGSPTFCGLARGFA